MVFGDYCPIILTFSCYNLKKSSKDSLGDVCTSDEKVPERSITGIELEFDEKYGQQPPTTAMICY